jgi:hypothetical protein
LICRREEDGHPPAPGRWSWIDKKRKRPFSAVRIGKPIARIETESITAESDI